MVYQRDASNQNYKALSDLPVSPPAIGSIMALSSQTETSAFTVKFFNKGLPIIHPVFFPEHTPVAFGCLTKSAAPDSFTFLFFGP